MSIMPIVFFIDWAGPPLSGEQAIVLRKIAIRYLQLDLEEERITFTHLLIEGQLKYRGFLSLGNLRGRRFFADFGTHRDMPWNCEFILPRGTEYVELDDEVRQWISYGNGSTDPIDLSQTRITDANIISL
jgi:hypothetical protein